MSSLVIDTNTNINSNDSLVMSIAESTVASFKLEGIVITYEEAFKMASASVRKRRNRIKRQSK